MLREMEKASILCIDLQTFLLEIILRIILDKCKKAIVNYLRLINFIVKLKGTWRDDHSDPTKKGTRKKENKKKKRKYLTTSLTNRI